MLPLVVMAEGDNPYMAELPSALKKLVRIEHPQYKQFEDLDLKWVQFPALSQLGFDIGGVQFTSTPFIGWFMDSEIGVRNLADTFRYDALPSVVRALGLHRGKPESMDDWPGYERLAALVSTTPWSRASNTDKV